MVKISQIYIDSVLTHFHLPTWAVYIEPMKNIVLSLKNKMDNPVFVDEEGIPLINQDEDYDNYRTPGTSRVETSFIGAVSTLRLRQRRKRDKIVSLYRYLDVTGDPGLADLD